MALKYFDRVRETSITTGTGDITVTGAVASFESFGSVLSVSDTFYYCFSDRVGNWEVGLGTYTATNTIQRTTVYASSNNNLAVDFAAGMKDVILTVPSKFFTDYMASEGAKFVAGDKAKLDTAAYYEITYSKAGSIETQVGAVPRIIERAGTVTEAYCKLGTAGSGNSTITIKNGANTVASVATNSTSVVPMTITNDALVDGDALTVDITQSATPAENIGIILIVRLT